MRTIFHELMSQEDTFKKQGRGIPRLFMREERVEGMEGMRYSNGLAPIISYNDSFLYLLQVQFIVFPMIGYLDSLCVPKYSFCLEKNSNRHTLS